MKSRPEFTPKSKAFPQRITLSSNPVSKSQYILSKEKLISHLSIVNLSQMLSKMILPHESLSSSRTLTQLDRTIVSGMRLVVFSLVPEEIWTTSVWSIAGVDRAGESWACSVSLLAVGCFWEEWRTLTEMLISKGSLLKLVKLWAVCCFPRIWDESVSP